MAIKPIIYSGAILFAILLCVVEPIEAENESNFSLVCHELYFTGMISLLQTFARKLSCVKQISLSFKTFFSVLIYAYLYNIIFGEMLRISES